MLGLPKNTEFNRRIPKQKIYENIQVSPALKRSFAEKIKAIYWRNKIAPSTMNLAHGDSVNEIQVIEVRLAAPQPDTAVLKLIDKAIPYQILFLLEYEGRYQAWIAYKETAAKGSNAVRVDAYYHTDWLSEQDIHLKAEGLNIDAVYENFVRQIAGEALSAESPEPLKEAVERDLQKQKLQKQIAVLEKRMWNEKQYNKQVQMNEQLRQLKKELEIM